MKYLIKYSLSFMWVLTGLTSIFWAKDIGYEILLKADIKNTLAEVLIYGGGILDIIIGLWLLTNYQLRINCIVQITVIIIFTILLSIIDPVFWLHPFGPVVKNIPVLVLIYILFKSEEMPILKNRQ